MDTDDLEREIERSWVANAAAWTDVVRQDLIESRRVATNRAVLDAILERSPRKVVDVGCGEGWLAHSLAEHGVDVIGFDSSAALVDRSRTGPGTFHVLSYHSFAANPGQLGRNFDVAVCNFSLLGKDIGLVLQGCASVLAPGGALVVQTVHPFTDAAQGPYEDGWRREDFSGMKAAFGATTPWYFRTVSTWVAEVVQAGFRIEELREPVHPESKQPLSLLLIAKYE